MRFIDLVCAGVGVIAGAAQASSCTVQQLHWARTSASGEIVVGASFGTVRSLDHGKTWQEVPSPSPAPAATGGGATMFFAGADGSMAYAGPDKLWVRFAAGAGWTMIEGRSLTSVPWMRCHKASL